MGCRVDNGRGVGRPKAAGAAHRAAAGLPSRNLTSTAAGSAENKKLGVAILLAAMLAVTAVTVAAAPSLAQTSGNFPDYVFQEDGSVRIEGDAVTDCRSFASFLEEGYFELGDISAGAQRVLEQCAEAGLLDPELAASAGAPTGAGGGLPDTGGPDLPALLAVSGALAMTGGLLARKIATA